MKPWILTNRNDFLTNPSQRTKRPTGKSPGSDFEYTQLNFDDSQWQSVTIPHDWAISGPFYKGEDPVVGGGMGRLPSPRVAWYRNKLTFTEADKGKSILLDVDGAMSYAMVRLNGHLVGGWPFGYASWQVDLTPYVNYNSDNQLAIRIDNPAASSRWYPGAGLYRNIWLTKTAKTHISKWGTHITTPKVSKQQAQVESAISVDNDAQTTQKISAITQIFLFVENGNKLAKSVATIASKEVTVQANQKATLTASTIIKNPKLWGPYPTQTPNLYIAVTTIKNKQRTLDKIETRFGVRDLLFDANKGIFVNNEHTYLKGVNQHHYLGALGTAYNVRAAKRQLEMLREMGVNAIRMAHNPPAPELLELTDKVGFLVVNEIFNVWERKKIPHDSHLIFADWSEADLRSFIRRDRNSPSVILWSDGNEVGEQYTEKDGAAVGKRLHEIAQQGDPTRPTAASMNYAQADMEFPKVMSTISLNCQGEGIRNAQNYAHLKGKKTKMVRFI